MVVRATHFDSRESNNVLNVTPRQTWPCFQHKSNQCSRHRRSGARSRVTFCTPCTSLLRPVGCHLNSNKHTTRVVNIAVLVLLPIVLATLSEY